MNAKILPGIIIGISSLVLSSCEEGGEHGNGPQNFEGEKSLTLEFTLNDAVALVANEDLVEEDRSASRSFTRDGRSLFKYRIATREGEADGTGDGSGNSDSEEEVGASNLLAIDDEGNATPAITTDYPLKVMYTVANPDGTKVYLALETGWENWDGNDYSRFIAQTNCALFEVTVATNEYECVAEGLFVQSMDDDYMKAVSGNQKPIQFDDNGNMYFAATSFTREESEWENCYFDEEAGNDVCEIYTDYWINGWGNWNPIVYRYQEDGTTSNVSQDTESVGFFLVLPSGELVYQSWDQASGGNTLKMIRANGNVTPLTDDDMWISFFAVDSSNTVLYGTENWGAGNERGIQMARPTDSGFTEFANLDTSLFGSNSQNSGWQSPTPRRVILADDGRLYGVFEGGRDNYDPNTNNWTWTATLKVFQILPFDAVPKVELDLGNDWWSWMQDTPFQIANGFMYYTDEISVPGQGSADVIKMVDLDTRDVTTLLHPIVSYSPLVLDDRFTLYNWRLSAETLYFSALNLDSNTVVMGEIDTSLIATASSSSEYLTIQETASASGAASAVQDIEVINATELTDDGNAPEVLEVFNDSENMFSLSIDFSEPMNFESVESALTLTSDNTAEGDSGSVPYLPLWIGSTVHMIPDLQDSETDVPTWYPSLALLYPTTVPMTFGETYTIGGFATSMTDRFENGLTVPTFGASENVVSIRPQNGWYQSTLTQTVPAAVADADVLKFAAPFDQYDWKNYTLNNDLPEHFRVEFSAINFGWDGVQIAIFDQENADANGANDWWVNTLLKLRLGNWTELNYQTSRNWNGTNSYDWYNSQWDSDETRNAFDGKWKRYRVDVYGANIDISISEDGTTFSALEKTYSDPVEDFNVTDFVGLADANDDSNGDTQFHLVLRTVSALALDDVEITTLLANGAIATAAGDLTDLDGSSVPAELGSTASYGFDNW